MFLSEFVCVSTYLFDLGEIVIFEHYATQVEV